MFRSLVKSSNLLKNSISVNSSKRFFATEASDDLLTFSLLSPHQTIYKDKKAQLVTLPGAKGVFGIAKNHVPKISELKPGIVQINHENGDLEKFFVSGGFAFVNPDASCYINVIEAVPVDQLDPNEVKNGLARYTQLFNEAQDENAKAVALVGLEAHQQMAYACGVSV
ncbi:hypothetical protein DICPUDRAFT_92704 [Dictyostelium purpureum]|uniref:ATP synthase F1 complex delta/epsilon subunit N-terminal domain-containing protein n=1 Tax=Dictyostelium purpureum TaxID=5786 RepID=F0ZVW0_DICPU|nr:uncharacterized protein DICPUDRAFT_92704 [Dictyostelium purpureum]EGC31922.1 hypothetical protein DICPUDRAFT_92704 [Dictyostelium purpureum]|eukprot:XP_003291559.1 hypothetical protein DICPUDRAFT_92704 [Dictyostelium purpureum]